MDALIRAAWVLAEPRYHAQAVELARAVIPRFLQRSPANIPMGVAWKMSIDLSCPLVAGFSPHEALDGYVTFRWLIQAGRCWLRRSGEATATAELAEAIAILGELSADPSWATSDALGIGGLLLDAFRLAILPDRTLADEARVRNVLIGADVGLRQFVRHRSLEHSASGRLAFRELGLAIGLQTLPALAATADRAPAIAADLQSLLAQADVGRKIVDFWCEPESRDVATWWDHRDINEVMLATALLAAQVETGAGAAADRSG